MKKANSKKRIIIIAATFHTESVEQMIAFTQKEFKVWGFPLSEVVRVPGCFEMPLAVKHVLSQKDVSGALVLGAIEKGETLHGEVMGHVVYRSLIDLELQYSKPIGIGIIGPGATPKQIQSRRESTAQSAVRALISLLN